MNQLNNLFKRNGELARPLNSAEQKAFSDYVGDSYNYAHQKINEKEVKETMRLLFAINDILKKTHEMRVKYDKQRKNY